MAYSISFIDLTSDEHSITGMFNIEWEPSEGYQAFFQVYANLGPTGLGADLVKQVPIDRTTNMAKIDGLEPATTYYCRGVASSTINSADTPIQSVTTGAVITVTVESVAVWPTAAKFITTIWQSGAGSEVSETVEYGTDESYGTTVILDATSSIDGLMPNTTYYYRLTVTNESGQSAFATGTFKTEAAPAPAVGVPEVEKPTVTYLAEEWFDVTTKIIALNGESILEISIGLFSDEALSNNLDICILPDINESARFRGLEHNTTYYLRAGVMNEEYYGYSDTLAVTTLGYPPQVEVLGETLDYHSITLDINIVLDHNATSQGYTLEYGTTTDYGTVLENTNQMTGLTHNTRYYYKITATDNWGRTGVLTGSIMTAKLNPPVLAIPEVTVKENRDGTLYIKPNYPLENDGSITKAILYIRWAHPVVEDVINQEQYDVIDTLDVTTRYELPYNNYTYEVQTYMENEAGGAYSEVVTAITPGNRPIVNTKVSSKSAYTADILVNCELDMNATVQSCRVDYGTSTAYDQYLESSDITVDAYDNFYVTLSGLTHNTTYYYKVSVTDNWGRMGIATGTFTTNAVLPPVVAPLTISTVDDPKERIHIVMPKPEQNGTLSKYSFAISMNEDMSNPEKAEEFIYDSTQSEVDIYYNERQHNTTYYIQGGWMNEAGWGYSDILTVTTEGNPPVVTLNYKPKLEPYRAYIYYATTPDYNAKVEKTIIEYGTTTDYENLDTGNAWLLNLTPETKYYYRITATDNWGRTGYLTGTFTTLARSVPEVGRFISVGSSGTNTTFEISKVQSYEEITKCCVELYNDENLTDLVSRKEQDYDSRFTKQTVSITVVEPYKVYYARGGCKNDVGWGYRGPIRCVIYGPTPKATITSIQLTDTEAQINFDIQHHERIKIDRWRILYKVQGSDNDYYYMPYNVNILTDLTPDTTYEFKIQNHYTLIEASNYGGVATSLTESFTTRRGYVKGHVKRYVGNIGVVWKQGITYVKVDGEWKKSKEAYQKKAGTWNGTNS